MYKFKFVKVEDSEWLVDIRNGYVIIPRRILYSLESP